MAEIVLNICWFALGAMMAAVCLFMIPIVIAVVKTIMELWREGHEHGPSES